MPDVTQASEPKDYTPKPPKQVQDAIAAADALRAEMEKPADSPSQEGDGAPPAPPQAAEGQPQPPPAPRAEPPAAEDEQSWEQRYKSLHGRYENVQRNYQQQGQRIDQLETLIASLKVKGAEEPRQPDPAAPPPPKPRYVTEQQAQEYGDEFLDVVGKRAKEEYAPEFEQLANRLARLEGRVDATGQIIDKTQTKDVYGTLNSELPNWRDINRHDAFKEWLLHPDPYSGRVRGEMLKEAFDRHEANRVVSFFRGFLTEATGTPSESSSPGQSAPPLPNGNGVAPGNGSGKPSLEDFAAPGRARSAPQEMPPDKPIYTSAWIAKFMADKRTGKYRGREADAEAIERDIYTAQHEGRIQG